MLLLLPSRFLLNITISKLLPNISISEKYATWDHAQTLCSNIGGYLAEIKTIGEHVFLVKIYCEVKSSTFKLLAMVI